MIKIIISAIALFSVLDPCLAASRLSVTVANKLPAARAGQTIELSAGDLGPIGVADLRNVHVHDATGAEVLCQAVDSDYDEYRKADRVIFQADFAPGEKKTFKLSAGAKQEYKKGDFKAFGRFVRERFDDFAWENDRIAHRAYGKALETWRGEPLTSSGIDIWSKRVPALVINEWYLLDNYHTDTGEGCDAYSAGSSRGCGGSGLWAGDKLWVSRNFVDSRVLANGPIRVMFELVYEPFEVNGVKVSEVKRVTLDAGSQLDRFDTVYTTQGSGAEPLVQAVGFKKIQGARKEFNPDRGWLVIWEPMAKSMGMQGLAAVVDPRSIDKLTEDKLNELLLVKPGAGNSITYWAGFAWDKAGRVTTAEAWKAHVDQFAQSIASPLEIQITPE